MYHSQLAFSVEHPRSYLRSLPRRSGPLTARSKTTVTLPSFDIASDPGDHHM
jgi:hypothetical protein